MENLSRFLKDIQFFQNLPSDYMDFIVGCASNMRFSPGEFLFQEGEPVHCFYVLRVGSVTMEYQVPGFGSLTIQSLDGGDIVGWSWLIPPHHARLSARARTAVRAMAFDGRCLRQKCEENHDLGYELHKRFTQLIIKRLDATRDQLMDVCQKPENLIF